MPFSLKTIYLFTGITTVLIFIATGQYLKHYFPDKSQIDLAFRVMQRSRHIFILLSGLIIAGIGTYIQTASNRWLLIVQYVALAVIVTSNGLFIYCFFYEVNVHFIPKTPFLHLATYTMLVGVTLNFIATFKRFT